MVETGTSGKYVVDINNANLAVIGDHSSIMVQEPREQWLIEESLDDVRSAEFVPPSGVETLVQKLQEQHLLVLCGPNRMGKATLAQFLAACIQSQKARVVFRVRRRGQLEEIVDYVTARQDLIILAYDVDHRQLGPLTESLHEAALGTNNYVLLTSDSPKESWHIPAECAACLVHVAPGWPYSRSDLERLLIKRVGEKAKLLPAQGMKLRFVADALNSPSQVVRFARALSTFSKPLERSDLECLIERLKDVRVEVGAWFEGLDRDRRYLGLALALFDDLPDPAFWMLYERMVTAWQERDHNIVSLDYYALREMQPWVRIEPRIGFQESDFRDAVLNLYLDQFQRSLVWALPTLEALVKEHSGKDKEETTIRTAAAQALGQICPLAWGESERVLLDWAIHSVDRVRATVGHALRQVVRDHGVEALPDVLRMLDRWHATHLPPSRDLDTSDLYRVRWTLASSLGRLGAAIPADVFKSEIWPRIELLSRDEHYYVRRSAVYTLRWLGVSHLAETQQMLNERGGDWHEKVRAEVVAVLCQLSTIHWTEVHALLRRWLRGPDPERHQTAFWTVLQLGKGHPDLVADLYATADQSEALQTSVYDEMIALLRREGQEVEAVNGLLECLVRKEAPAGSYFLIESLVHALDHKLPGAMHLLNTWQETEHLELVEVLQAVLGKLERMREDRRQRQEYLVEHQLYQDSELQAFARTLPEEEQRAFWQEVHDRREEDRLVRVRQAEEKRRLEEIKHQEQVRLERERRRREEEARQERQRQQEIRRQQEIARRQEQLRLEAKAQQSAKRKRTIKIALLIIAVALAGPTWCCLSCAVENLLNSF